MAPDESFIHTNFGSARARDLNFMRRKTLQTLNQFIWVSTDIDTKNVCGFEHTIETILIVMFIFPYLCKLVFFFVIVSFSRAIYFYIAERRELKL